MTEDGGSDRDALEGLTRPDSRILLAPPPRSSPDDIFGSFVQNANTAWVASVEAALAEMDAEPDPTEHDAAEHDAAEHDAAEHDAAEHDASVAAPAPLDGPGSDRDPQGTDRVVMLTRRRFSSRSEDLGEVESDAHIQHLENDEAPVGDEAEAVTVRVPLPGSPETPARRRGRPARDTTAPIELPDRVLAPERTASDLHQKREAARLVPDVAHVLPVDAPIPESSEDGQMPSGELSRALADVEVLLRFGHAAQVEAIFADLRRRHPQDLLLLRHVAEFHIAHGHKPLALEALFLLASGLFERRNVEGMRQAVGQALVLDPENRRAQRLQHLLRLRPEPADGERKGPGSAPPQRPGTG